MSDQKSMDDAISRLEAMDRTGLTQAWTKVFGSVPAMSLSLGFLRRVLAHDLQKRKFGSLSPADRRSLQSFLNDKSSPQPSPSTLTVGAHLVREWQGRTYLVEVVEAGYRFDGQVYRSLTAIANRITGTHWSGPRFFGFTTRGRRRHA